MIFIKRGSVVASAIWVVALSLVFTSSSTTPVFAVTIQPDDIFTFDVADVNNPVEGFTSSVGSPPTSLTPFGPCPTTPTAPCNATSAFGTDGADSFWEFTSTSARWGGGFSYNPPVNIGDSYTFFMKFQIPTNGYSTKRPYTKLVDFKNLQSDNGLYFFKETVSGQTKYSLKLFPSASGSPTKFAPGQLMDLAIVRDNVNKMFKVYSRSGGTFTLEYQRDDTARDGVAVTSNGGSLLHFFANDKAFDEGATAGRIYDLRFWHNQALTIDELNAVPTPRPKAIITPQVTTYLAQSEPLTTPLATLSFTDSSSFTNGDDLTRFPEANRVITYTVADPGGTGCALTGTPPALTATSAGTCLISATIPEYTVPPANVGDSPGGFIGTTTSFPITITAPPPPPTPPKPPTPTEWNPETTTFQIDTFPGVINLPPPPNPPGGGSYTFTTHSTSTSLCTSDRDTPTITVPQPGTCIITATVGATKNFSRSSVTVEFTITGGPMLAATGTPAWPVWAGVLAGLGIFLVSAGHLRRRESGGKA